MPVQQNLDLLTRLAYLKAGGQDQGQRDIDKINQTFSGVNNISKTIMDYIAAKDATDKAALERKKLEQETTPQSNYGVGDTSIDTKQKLQQAFNTEVPIQTTGRTEIDRGNGVTEEVPYNIPVETPDARIQRLQNEIQQRTLEARKGQTPVGLAKDIATTEYIKAGTPVREAQVALTESQTVKNLREPVSKPNITTPVISGGISSREFVKTLKPDLQEGEDMPYGEFMRRAALLQAETTAGQPKPISSEQIDKVTQIKNAITGSADIKKQYFDLLGEGKSPVDPIGGRWSSFKEKLGVMGDSEVVKFQTDLVGQLNTYLNALSGAALTAQEADRLMKRLPKIGSTNEQFLGQMDSFEGELKRSLSNRIETLGQANFNIGELKQYIIKKDEQKNNQPKDSGRYINITLNGETRAIPEKNVSAFLKAYPKAKTGGLANVGQ